MALTADQISAIRREVGSTPDDPTLNAEYDRLGDIGVVALSILETRLANLESGPASFTVFGEYAQSTEQNIIALRERLSRLRSAVTDDSGIGGSTLNIIYPSYGSNSR